MLIYFDVLSGGGQQLSILSLTFLVGVVLGSGEGAQKPGHIVTASR